MVVAMHDTAYRRVGAQMAPCTAVRVDARDHVEGAQITQRPTHSIRAVNKTLEKALSPEFRHVLTGVLLRDDPHRSLAAMADGQAFDVASVQRLSEHLERGYW